MPCPPGSGLAVALAISFGTIVFLGGSFLYEWYTQRSEGGQAKEAETGYYRLPPPKDCAAACANAIEEDLLEQRLEFGGGLRRQDEYSSGRRSRRGMCVCCFERRQRFMFVLCRHICLCEPCLMQAARTYEETVLFGAFDGPVKMPCLVCRKVSYIVKIFAS
ncbi:Zinc finger C3HC4 type (RING finger) containing protein [Leishmania donovani]|uniref:Zinc_finger_-_C3HC4_type_(RING_finger )_containing_protein_-_putative n=3 Tax=Leishmania donovani species complex TaxID=38574 RepID=A0A6L0WRM5_LEIIN|nr:hypothetical protein, unknown function [Leishmania infantum JPCM5]XP_003858884.1 hypothetical protein, unknown function [Leishmania donovani]CAC9457160.1 Zinc_finger_-_C3HC4_type_(RING_finger)_containing_protein_-_putative [Leishmania infantum]TPP46631.1 Zinc finger, C3HC4 type (RING finger) family protein [Leishmania donovani]TPP51600.1 Zinc finger, C3HC4 type (RING finger) family protein [Leishmania donovani]CAJ1986719.1 Zinc finger C3HC4 type (RING finger) containing protein [Leishmania |eukprot:XP_001463692.1 hypothetical protein, unknown function [Leishmania infantum JPCM5]